MRILIATALASLTLVLFQADAPAVRSNRPGSRRRTGRPDHVGRRRTDGRACWSAQGAPAPPSPITVASDAQGHYSFPAAKLDPGQYTLRIRAVGYDLDSPATVDVGAQKASVADLKLRKTEDLASQLSNGEWIASVPGTDQQKSSLLNCIGCHTLERVVKSQHTDRRFHAGASPHAGLRQSEHPGRAAVAACGTSDGGARRSARAGLSRRLPTISARSISATARRGAIR